MQLFNRNVSVRGLTVFGFEVVLISGSMALAAQLHGPLDAPGDTAWKVAFVTVLCQLCFYYNDLYDLTIVNSSRELVVQRNPVQPIPHRCGQQRLKHGPILGPLRGHPKRPARSKAGSRAASRMQQVGLGAHHRQASHPPSP